MTTGAATQEAISPRTAGDLTRRRAPLKALTGVRFFASAWVVLFHTRLTAVLVDHGWHRTSNFFGCAYLAIPTFFLLSGFILAYTYAGQFAAPGNVRRFLEARFARSWPVYALSLLAMSFPSFDFPPPGSAVAALLMVQAWNPWNPQLAGAWNMVCWTLSCEALYYFCFPRIQRAVDRQAEKTVWTALGGIMLVAVALNTAPRTLGYPAEGVFRYMPLPVIHLPEFLAGVLLGNGFIRRPRGRKGGYTYGSMAVLAVAAITVTVDDWWATVPLVGLAALLFGLATERTWVSRFLSTPAMLVGGAMSYTIYLMQMPAKIWVAMACKRLGIASNGVRLTLTFVVLMGVAYVFYRYMEEPVRRYLRGLFARWETRRSMGSRFAEQDGGTQ
jgi:peptidoglycan/LPS O-acetylase OafA/YrhL